MLQNCKSIIILRQPIEKDIDIRVKLRLNKECVRMCGGNISNFGQFAFNDAIKWCDKIIQHPCKWIIEYNGNCIGVTGLRPYKKDKFIKYVIRSQNRILHNGTLVKLKMEKYTMHDKVSINRLISRLEKSSLIFNSLLNISILLRN